MQRRELLQEFPGAGGGYYRGTTEEFPSTTSSFYLDKYEVTLGRMKEFMAEYDNWTPTAGDGEHMPGAGTGWSADWNKGEELPATVADYEWDPQNYFSSTRVNDTGDTLPINMMTWYMAFAFCIWDGGRLPTEAEWETVTGRLRTIPCGAWACGAREVCPRGGSARETGVVVRV